LKLIRKHCSNILLSALAVGYWTGLAIGSGAHRLFSHKSYEAKWPLRLFLIFGQSVAGQVSEKTESYYVMNKNIS